MVKFEPNVTINKLSLEDKWRLENRFDTLLPTPWICFTAVFIGESHYRTISDAQLSQMMLEDLFP